MNFKMHKSGLHYYDPAEDFTFVTTVTDNKKHYIKLHIKAEDMSEELYEIVTYTYVADHRWVIKSNQIKDSHVTVQDTYVAIAIWGKYIFALKINTTRKKKILVIEELIQFPKELIKHHRDIVMTADILFVNTIPFFLTIIRKN